MKLIDSLKWRYATKKYDTSKKVSQENIDYIKEAVQLSASSYGLQPYKVLIIENAELREKLKPLSWGQSQITDASHLFVFCNYTNVTEHHIDDLINLKSNITGVEISNIAGYRDFVKGKIKEKSTQEMISWTAKQSYLALANALIACAELEIDCTPIEGFEPKDYNEVLGLKDKGLNASVVLAIGYRHNEDITQGINKVRKPISLIFESL